MAVEVHGLDALVGETAFAFFVLRLREPLDRAGVIELMRYVAPLIPEVDTFIEELPEDFEDTVRILALPWTPAEAGHAAHSQRRLIEAAASQGVEAAWFFQTGTSLPQEGDEAEEAPERPRGTPTDETWSGSGDTKTQPIEIVDLTGDEGRDTLEEDDALRTAVECAIDEDEDEDDEDDDDDDDDDDAGGDDDDDLDDDDDDDEDDDPDDDDGLVVADDVTWSHGPPPQVAKTRFPVDGYPAIVDELDWEDFGIAFKLRGDALPGEGTVLLAFHTLWLAPYCGRYRNAAVTFDRKHHAAHLWVDRFAVPCSADEQVRHLLWIVTKLDEVVPIVHARFAGATMAQKYGGLMGDSNEPFVLGGNPLVVIYSVGGEAAVDGWIAQQTEWSSEEVAQMLRELAVAIVTGGEPDRGDEDEDRGRKITGFPCSGIPQRFACELLAARAKAGKLDPRAADRLVPALIKILDDITIDDKARTVAAAALEACRAKPLLDKPGKPGADERDTN